MAERGNTTPLKRYDERGIRSPSTLFILHEPYYCSSRVTIMVCSNHLGFRWERPGSWSWLESYKCRSGGRALRLFLFLFFFGLETGPKPIAMERIRRLETLDLRIESAVVFLETHFK